MIYLIGGPPKCGKTTIAKLLSKKKSIPWVSSDALQVVSRHYVAKYVTKEAMKKLYPSSTSATTTNDERYASHTPKQIVKNYIRQAKSTYDAVDMFIASELADGNDYIIEGYHVTPQLSMRLQKKYGTNNFKTVFLGKQDVPLMVQNFVKSTTPNDWVLTKTCNKETFVKIAEMIAEYSEQVSTQAKNYGFCVVWTDTEFTQTMKKILNRF